MLLFIVCWEGSLKYVCNNCFFFGKCSFQGYCGMETILKMSSVNKRWVKFITTTGCDDKSLS